MSIEKPRRAWRPDGLFIVGLVGRTGSGKSTLAKVAAEGGAVVIEGDAIGHLVTDRDERVRLALEAEYGTSVYREDGTLDRAAVASRVFADSAARERLDGLVHPRIIEAIGTRLERLRAKGFRGFVVIDAALLLEWGLEGWCDAVVAVIAPERDRIGRLTRSRGWSEEEALRRLAAQRSDEAFAAAADLAVENEGDAPQRFESRVRGVLAALETLRLQRQSEASPG